MHDKPVAFNPTAIPSMPRRTPCRAPLSRGATGAYPARPSTCGLMTPRLARRPHRTN